MFIRLYTFDLNMKYLCFANFSVNICLKVIVLVTIQTYNSVVSIEYFFFEGGGVMVKFLIRELVGR